MEHTLGPDEAIEEVLAVRAAMNAADEERDLETYLGYCTDDVVAMPPRSPPVQGIDDLRAFLEEVHSGDETQERSFTYRTHSLVVRGDQAFDHGTLEVRSGGTGADDEPDGELDYVDTYRRSPDGAWRMDTAAWFAPE